ncbi:UNVERIFIED_CONTAM: hypothetical protein RMT77_016318 [Armadillidium vulgare]
MGDIFVRRTTGFLLITCAILMLICASLLVLLISFQETSKQNDTVINNENKISNTDSLSDSFKKVSRKNVPENVQTESSKNYWEYSIRLPKETIPYHYDILFHPNFETKVFMGRVNILIGVMSKMNYLLTHAKYMNISSTSLSDTFGKEYKILNSFEYKENEFWVVIPEKQLTPKNYTLSINFSGNLEGHIVGFYTSNYTSESGELRTIATTKFQPTDARRAFPCFDEPGFKSTFKITLIRPKEGYIALSNMPVEREIWNTPTENEVKVEFEKSVPMVTYLLCFIVCDFDYVEKLTSANKKFRVYSNKDQIPRTKYSLELGVNVLNYFERYFGLQYPLPKQDMIAIPDFVSGAMEHWGLITFRETNILYDPSESSSSNKQRVASVISHELAHMWFGNLVTLKWWDDLWLNEGFASYIEYKGVAYHEPDWEMMNQFVTSDLQPVFQLDQILSSHPIIQEVNHPNEITEIFDKISYSKGASVLRMLEHFIGEENFRVGVNRFLEQFKYGSAITQDLWNAVQEGNKLVNITRVMDTWTRQMGFPVLYVSAPLEQRGIMKVRQKRFLIDPDAQSKDDSPFHYKWDVPVTFKTNNQNRTLTWLKMDDDSITIKLENESYDWAKFNTNQEGYYRVNYDDVLWKKLTDLLNKKHEVISSADRANLIDDSFSLASAKMLHYRTTFNLISYLPKEYHFVPWSAAYSHITSIGNLMRNTKGYKTFRNYVKKLIESHVREIDWNDRGSHLTRRKRVLILGLACEYGHKLCLIKAKKNFQDWIFSKNKTIPVNLRSIVYNFGLKESGEEEWDILYDRFTKSLNAQEKSKMLKALTSSKDLWICSRFLDLGKNSSVVRRQDFLTMITYTAYNPSCLQTAWNFIRLNWGWLITEYGLNNRYLGRMIRSVAFQFTTDVQLEELEHFFRKYPDAGSGKRARLQAVEKVRDNIKWINSYSSEISSVFESIKF